MVVVACGGVGVARPSERTDRTGAVAAPRASEATCKPSPVADDGEELWDMPRPRPH